MFTLFQQIFFPLEVITKAPLVGNQKWYSYLPALGMLINSPPFDLANQNTFWIPYIFLLKITSQLQLTCHCHSVGCTVDSNS